MAGMQRAHGWHQGDFAAPRANGRNRALKLRQPAYDAQMTLRSLLFQYFGRRFHPVAGRTHVVDASRG
jgi:hypothetical protein